MIKKVKKIDKSLYWKVHTPQLLQEIATNNGVAILKIPLNIFQKLLLEVAERAIEINDLKLNFLMCKLTLYEQSDPTSKDYDKNIFKKLESQIKKYDKSQQTHKKSLVSKS